MQQIKTVIPFPPFGYRIYVIFTDDLIFTASDLVKKGLLGKDNDIDDTTGGFTVRFKNKGYAYIILKTDASIDDIVHETYHALCNMFKWIGAVHEEEVFAYNHGYLVGQVCFDQEKAKKKLKKDLTNKKS